MTIARPTPDDYPRWHEDVRIYEVFEDADHIASFYLDPYSRPAEKRGGAWHSSARNRSRALASAPTRTSSCPSPTWSATRPRRSRTSPP